VNQEIRPVLQQQPDAMTVTKTGGPIAFPQSFDSGRNRAVAQLGTAELAGAVRLVAQTCTARTLLCRLGAWQPRSLAWQSRSSWITPEMQYRKYVGVCTLRWVWRVPFLSLRSVNNFCAA
jgi:hypothetical protein